MTIRNWLLGAAVAVVAVVPAANAEQEDTMRSTGFVAIPHMKGTLALQVASINGLWYVPGTEDKAALLRVLSPALSEAKTLSGADADALWNVFHGEAAGGDFLFVGHMGGTLAIPRAQIRTAYYSEDTGSPRLRLMYDGDPTGKTLEGDEAVRTWALIRPAE